ncbi:MAG: hypothetical protein RR416_04910 [Clostridia bacterium]
MDMKRNKLKKAEKGKNKESVKNLTIGQRGGGECWVCVGLCVVCVELGVVCVELGVWSSEWGKKLSKKLQYNLKKAFQIVVQE